MKRVREWVSGEERPTAKQLGVFSNATSVPFGYLFLSDPPDERIRIPHFRTYGDEPARNPSASLIDTVQIIEQRQDWMREYLMADGADPLEFAESADPTDPYAETARAMRGEIGIGHEWAAGHPNWDSALSDMKLKIEDIGVFLSTNGVVGRYNNRRLDPAEFRGFVLMDEYAPFIFINGKDFKAAQMFTLAHELAHVWMGKSAIFDLQDMRPADNFIEIACNRVAAEFLVPQDAIVQKWAEFDEDDPFRAGARHFKVSEVVIARRALDSQLISRDEFLKFYRRQQNGTKPKKEERRGHFYRTALARVGNAFMRNVIYAVMEGKLLYRDAYSLTGLNRKSFDGMVKYIARRDEDA